MINQLVQDKIKEISLKLKDTKNEDERINILSAFAEELIKNSYNSGSSESLEKYMKFKSQLERQIIY